MLYRKNKDFVIFNGSGGKPNYYNQPLCADNAIRNIVEKGIIEFNKQNNKKITSDNIDIIDINIDFKNDIYIIKCAII
jgi:hypothetical protein